MSMLYAGFMAGMREDRLIKEQKEVRVTIGKKINSAKLEGMMPPLNRS